MTTVCNPDVQHAVEDFPGSDVAISTTHSISDYFRTAVCDAVRQEHVAVSEDTLWYLTQLFSNYHRTDRLFDFDANKSASATRPLTPLAEYYRMAVESDNATERRLYLQKLGDVAIFISSLYAGALKRKPVGVSYYMSMGESAYGCLADAPANTARHRALAGIFDELSREFTSLVPALSTLGRQENAENGGINHVKLTAETEDPDAEVRRARNAGSDNPNEDAACGLIIPTTSMLH